MAEFTWQSELAARPAGSPLLLGSERCWLAGEVVAEMLAVGERLHGSRVVGVLADNSPAWVIAVAITGMFLASVTIAVSGVLGGGLWSVIVPLFMLVCFAGATFPAVQVMALAPHGEEAGTAASILGAVNFGLSGAISPLVGVLGIGSAMSMGIVQAGALACAIVTLWIVVRPWTVPRIAD